MARVRRLVREHHGAERAADVEPLASLGQRLARPVDQRLRLALADAGEQAELVPSEAVRGSVVREHGRELGAESREQCVSRGVAEAVVVALEPVEVEEHQHRRCDRVTRQPPFEVGNELTAVGETGEGVGGRLYAGQREQPSVLAERDRESHDDQPERRRREHDGEEVQPVEVVVHEDPRRGERADRRYGEERTPLHAQTCSCAVVHPGGCRDEEQGGGPEDVDPRSLHVRPLGGLEQVDAVGEGRREDAEAEEPPAQSGPPAGEREDAEDGREQEHVAERVREVRHDHGRRAGGDVGDEREDAPPRRRHPRRGRRWRRRARACPRSCGRASAEAGPSRRRGAGRSR